MKLCTVCLAVAAQPLSQDAVLQVPFAYSWLPQSQ